MKISTDRLESMASANKIKRSQPPRPRSARSEPTSKHGLAWRNALLMCLSLSAVSFAVYGRSLFNDFINFDDRVYITANPHVLSGLTADTLRWSFVTFTAGNWHPLTWISHALDVQEFGLAPGGHHLNGLIIHALNALLLFLLLRRATGYDGRSFVVAILFALHPLNVECVAWAAERKSLLSTMLFWFALGAYGWYVKRPSVARYGLLALLFAFGLMAKPMVITLPFVLLLVDYWPFCRIEAWTSPCEPWTTSRRPLLSLLLEKAPLLLLSVASAITTTVAQFRINAVIPLSAMPLSWRAENAVRSYALYLFKSAFPVGLAVFYPQTAVSSWRTSLFLLIVCGTSWWVWAERKQKPYLVTGWLWYLGTMVPVIGLVQVGSQAMADRYAYIPLVGVFVMVVWFLADIADSFACPLPQRLAFAAVVVLVLASLTWRQVGFWKNSICLWTHTLQVTRDNVVAEDNLATALADAGRDDDAITHFRNAIRIRPAEPKARLALGTLLQKHGQTGEAIKQYQIALSQTNDAEDLLALYTNLGAAYRETGNYSSAVDSFQQVLSRNPSNTAVMIALGRAMLLQATERLERNMDHPPTANDFIQLGSLWEQAGDVNRAKLAYQSALALNTKLSSAQSGLERLSRNTH